MTTLDAAVDVLQLIGEPTRARLMALLAHFELTVAEIVAVTRLAQSSVSTHLGKLREAGLVRDRKAGASTYYALGGGSMPASARKVWELVRAEVRDSLLEDDQERAAQLVRARDGAAAWPDTVAGEMERHWSPGRTWESLARAMVGLVQLGDVVDIGSGDGTVAQLVAPRARSWTCVDRSERMIDAARDRLSRAKNVRFAIGDAQDLPLRPGAFDAALLLHVLTHIESPGRACAEAARVLRPGGTLVAATLDAHDHGATTAAYGDVHAGFAPAALRRLLSRAGLHVEACEVTSRDARPPCLRVVTAFATKPTGNT
ncbi:MAG TPA: metalloregulator ArsR/SmtB family transcription factor [Polyangiaceae bacterium]|nr:metalloregulator ArsR/SmtB family transcription factor [Polyangiaceae bacterium]